ncbi:hypothetical protein [Zobellella maritima]|uniref:hypothetical protein n=1 Tax=Zobellella maritima TaxID=2059725 RepID=UPI0013002CF1|nr:hypothetical protein [Zobellella maritima]
MNRNDSDAALVPGSLIAPGLAEREVQVALALWSLGFSVTADTLTELYQSQ